MPSVWLAFMLNRPQYGLRVWSFFPVSEVIMNSERLGHQGATRNPGTLFYPAPV